MGKDGGMRHGVENAQAAARQIIVNEDFGVGEPIANTHNYLPALSLSRSCFGLFLG